MLQTVSTASHLIMVHLQEESGSIFSASSSQVAADRGKVSTCPLLFPRLKKSGSLCLSSSVAMCSGPLTTLLDPAGLTAEHQHLSCSGDLKTGCSAPDADSQVLNRGEYLFPWTHWL